MKYVHSVDTVLTVGPIVRGKGIIRFKNVFRLHVHKPQYMIDENIELFITCSVNGDGEVFPVDVNMLV